MKLSKLLVGLCVIPLGLVGCSSDSTTAGTSAETVTSSDTATAAPDTGTAQPGGIRLVSPDEAQTLANEPGVSIVDVRTADEFAQGHIAGATELDFYAADFRDQLNGLDRNGRYLIYCHSGNRSGQARGMMTELGFTDVADLDGGITSWEAAGKPTTK